MEKQNARSIIYKYFWILCFVLGGVGFIFIYFFNPHTWEIQSPWEYMLRILIYMILSFGVAFFPNTFKRQYLLLILPIVFLAGIIMQTFDYLGFSRLLRGVDNSKEYYVMLYLILYPFIIACLAFGYRMGGGSTGNCIKISFVGVVVLFSNFVDVSYNFFHPEMKPVIIEYNYYFKSWFGKFPTPVEELIFCMSHIPLIVGFLFLPLDKWIKKIFKLA